jgi:hypothetical protein
MGSLFSS